MAAMTTALSQARSINSDNLTVLVKAFQQRQAKRVMDVGCGSGRLAAKLVGAGFDVTGVDPRAEAIASARQLVPEAVFIQSAIETLPESVGVFDAACMVNTLHHVTPSEMKNALSNVLLRLIPGGELVVIEPVAGGSFFRCMRPIDDETEVCALAITAIEEIVDSGVAVLRDVLRWDRENRFDGLHGFIDYLLDVDTGRAEAIIQRHRELTRAWRENVSFRDGKAFLIQPLLCWKLTLQR